MSKRLYRSQKERIISGVAGGLGEYFDIDPVWVRLVFVLTVFAHGIGLVAYIVMWVIVPRQASQATSREVIQDNIHDIKQEFKDAEADIKQAFSPREGTSKPSIEERSAYVERNRAAYLLGLVLIALGGVLLISNLTPVWWVNWGRFWPALLILSGVLILLARKKR